MQGEHACEGEGLEDGRTCPVCGSLLPSKGIVLKERYVIANGKTVSLSTTEALIFARLLKGHPGTVARELLYEALIANRMTEANRPDEKTLNTHICHIRQKVAQVALKIETVYGVGFRILDVEANMEAVA